MDNFQMILASGSPRRIEMMRRSGAEPLIIKPEVDETVSSELTPEQAVMYLALKKALAVEEQVEFKENQWLISADTIVCRETNNVPEMSIIAGLYRNRMKRNMLLQACPTVIFARQDFSLTRLTNPTFPDSPYNTYRYLGLPPGPIFIPPVAAIDAVLNAETHNFLYMCAKEDFSGTHNFASTLSAHQRNAKKYQRAYKQRFKKAF